MSLPTLSGQGEILTRTTTCERTATRSHLGPGRQIRRSHRGFAIRLQLALLITLFASNGPTVRAEPATPAGSNRRKSEPPLASNVGTPPSESDAGKGDADTTTRTAPLYKAPPRDPVRYKFGIVPLSPIDKPWLVLSTTSTFAALSDTPQPYTSEKLLAERPKMTPSQGRSSPCQPEGT